MNTHFTHTSLTITKKINATVADLSSTGMYHVLITRFCLCKLNILK